MGTPRIPYATHCSKPHHPGAALCGQYDPWAWVWFKRFTQVATFRRCRNCDYIHARMQRARAEQRSKGGE